MTEQRELESRLAEGLRGVAARTPPPAIGLVDGARARWRRRRRTTALTVATALLVIVVPIGVTAVLGGGRTGSPEPPVDPVPVGWRTESWHDLSFRVPPGWGHGGGTDWCADGRTLRDPPQVSRPGAVRAIGCRPSYGFGLHFEEPSSGELPPGTVGTVQQYSGSRYPDGSWLGYVSTRQAAAWVVAPTRSLARLVLDSSEPIRGVDGNGCAVRVPERASSTSARVSVCRYDSGLLEQSELLSLRDSSRAILAVSHTASGADGGPPACAPVSREQPVVTLESNRLDVRLLPGQGCPLANVFLVGEWYPRVLTPQVVYWALSPGWSGSLGPDLPAPNRLRTG